MTLVQFTLRGLVLITLTVTLIACNKNSVDESELKVAASGQASGKTLKPNSEDDSPVAVVGASDIPYPMYPNGTKYRVGGENGLKIVVFQTEDAFQKVDDYYSELSDNAGMARIAAMRDYVRYSHGREDTDAWATDKPGIVIHEFEGDEARQAVGANTTAKTNIIMSF